MAASDADWTATEEDSFDAASAGSSSRSPECQTLRATKVAQAQA
jgi:hypothetical protein